MLLLLGIYWRGASKGEESGLLCAARSGVSRALLYAQVTFIHSGGEWRAEG